MLSATGPVTKFWVGKHQNIENMYCRNYFIIKKQKLHEMIRNLHKRAIFKKCLMK